MKTMKSRSVKRHAPGGLLVAALLLAFSLPTGSALAQTIWNTTTGNWNAPANWTLGVPNSASGTTFDAQIKNGGTAQLSAPGASVRRMRVGVSAGGGNLEVNGGGLTITDDLILNFQGTGTATTSVQNGGIVTVPATAVGDSGAGQSIFLITGAGSRVNATTSFVVGRAARGTLTLADGGTLAVGNGTLPLVIATLAGRDGALLIGNGGVAGVLQASEVRFGVTSGFLQFNHTGNLTFATQITGPGSVNKTGPGTTTLSATNSTYAGQTGVSGGTLAISADVNLGTAPGSFVPDQLQFFGGTLRATQSFTMHVNRGIDFGGTGTIDVDATKTLTYPNNLNLSAGRMTKTGAGALSLASLRIGVSGSSALVVTGGGTLATTAGILGDGVNVSGSATVSGPGTTWTTNTLTVGEEGTGTLEISGGGTLTTANSSVIAFTSTSTGTATVRGAGSTWNVGDDLTVGFEFPADGTLNIEDQALVHVAGALLIYQGIVNHSGGTLRFNDYFRAASGTFNFNSGTIQLAGNRNVGTDAAITDLFGVAPAISTGKGLTVEGNATLSKPLTIDGGTFKTNGLVIGAGGALDFDRGILELAGGTITGLTSLAIPTNGEFRASGVQSLRITGAAGSTITATGNLTLGNAAAVNGFGTQGTLQVGANAVTLLDANDVVFDSLALATLGNAGSPGTLNAANGLTLDFGGNFTGFGAVSTPNNVAKPLINNGHITGNSAAQKITLPGYVTGAGTFDNVNFTGTFSPGLSPTLTTVGSIALAPASTLIMELGGTSRGGQYDAILASGNLGIGGALNVTLIDGFNPAPGHTFDFFDWNTLSGTFASINLPSLAAGLAWDTSLLYSTGVLKVASPGFQAADFDEDGDVDGNDLTRWRNNFGTGTTHMQGDADGDADADGADFLTWQRQVGSGRAVSSTTKAFAAVPEPASAALWASAALLGVLAGNLPLGPRRRRGLR